MALINTRPVGSDLMKQVMNACCCDKSLRNQVHLPVGLIDGCSSTAEKPLVRVSSMIYPRSSSRWPISLWRWNIWEFNEISFSDGRSLNAVRCVCRVQGKCWTENWRNIRRLRHLLTFCESFVMGRLRRTRKLTERFVTRRFHRQMSRLVGHTTMFKVFIKTENSPNQWIVIYTNLMTFPVENTRNWWMQGDYIQNTNDARGRGGEAKKKKTNPADRCRTDRPIFSRRTNQEACSGVKKKVQKIRRK